MTDIYREIHIVCFFYINIMIKKFLLFNSPVQSCPMVPLSFAGTAGENTINCISNLAKLTALFFRCSINR